MKLKAEIEFISCVQRGIALYSISQPTTNIEIMKPKSSLMDANQDSLINLLFHLSPLPLLFSIHKV